MLGNVQKNKNVNICYFFVFLENLYFTVVEFAFFVSLLTFFFFNCKNIKTLEKEH